MMTTAHEHDTCDVSFIRDFIVTTEFLAGKFVMFREDKIAPVTSCHQRAFLFTNTRLFYVITTG